MQPLPNGMVALPRVLPRIRTHSSSGTPASTPHPSLRRWTKHVHLCAALTAALACAVIFVRVASVLSIHPTQRNLLRLESAMSEPQVQKLVDHKMLVAGQESGIAWLRPTKGITEDEVLDQLFEEVMNDAAQAAVDWRLLSDYADQGDAAEDTEEVDAWFSERPDAELRTTPGDSGAQDEDLDETKDSPPAVDKAGHRLASTQGYAFKMYEPGSLDYSDMEFCRGAQEPPAEAMQPIDSRINMLMILGAQKAGTTWLFNSLTSHPAFVGAEHGFARPPDPWKKEVHYFDRWPLRLPVDEKYVSCFPEDKVNASLARSREATTPPAFAFVDASPESLLVPHVAPRIKHVIPHAKFVIVLRDPVARMYSAWNMIRVHLCGSQNTKSLKECEYPGWHAVARGVLERPGDDGCLFNGTGPVGVKTWADCYKCTYTLFDPTACKQWPEDEQEQFMGCKKLYEYGLGSYSNYAAQIAWWLSFFPPERFIILTKEQLDDPDQQVEILNRIRMHAGLTAAEPFEAATFAKASGFKGSYDSPAHGYEQPLRRRFARSEADLQRLMDTYWPEDGFQGLKREV